VISEELRAGDGETLFVLSGAGGTAEEVLGLAHALGGDPRVIALVPVPPPGAQAATTVEAMATAAVSLMRAHQPRGPYRLLGYSLGGIIALESGQLMRDAGDLVSFLGLVDAPFDQRYWPRALFIRATARRAAVHIRGLLGKPPAQAWNELGERRRGLARRLRARVSEDRGEGGHGDPTIQDLNLAALARWQPRVLPWPVVLFTAEETDFGCDVAELWRPWLLGMQIRRLPGNHLEMVRERVGIDRLAAAIDEEFAVAASPRLRALVATTFRWSGAARLAAELSAAGCCVDAVGPSGSAVHEIAAVEKSYRLTLMDPIGSLRRAIESSPADVIVPFDDRTRQALHRIHAEADPATDPGARLRDRLERSLGPPELYSSIYSRVAITEIAAQCGVRCPQTAAVRSPADVRRWLERHGGPAVLKTDGSWGGRETCVIQTTADVGKGWRRLSRPPGIARCIKRLLVERDPWPLRARLTCDRPRLSIQSYVDGVPGNAAVACLEGETLGAIQAEVVRGWGTTGPSTVVRIVHDPEMLAAVTTMVKRLSMSGLIGLDFVLEAGTGHAHLIEVNPRATPTSHLVSAEGTDLLAAFRSALGYAGRPRRTRPYPSDGLVALFPQELRRDPGSELVDVAHHDIPWHAPDLVALALAELGPSVSSQVRDRLAMLAGSGPGSPVPTDSPGHDAREWTALPAAEVGSTTHTVGQN
jgi:thioesterase domain-containing protein